MSEWRRAQLAFIFTLFVVANLPFPLSIYAFTLPLPYIGAASRLPPGFVAVYSTMVHLGLKVSGREESQGEEQEHHHHRDEEQEWWRRRQRRQHQWEPEEDHRSCHHQYHQDALVHLGRPSDRPAV
ncbi:hypothetical protein GUJ93_ZPchr0007g3443 [Zizania palustris]|uniref:Uncharacterized protein n=1 Tax=Zizania palustris TaxID=103762 RepID=A0A8J5T3W5_ZIZPA|nr:hypothetical protein GUJ93_ZPchr0007g3443 [Zizania palustris]